MSCLGENYNPSVTRTWNRYQSRCFVDLSNNPTNYITMPLTGETVPYAEFAFNMQMLHKGNILQYKKNSFNITKKERYTKIAQGKWASKQRTWAIQSSRMTNPNTQYFQRANTINIDSSTLAQSDLPPSCPTLPPIPTVPVTNTPVTNGPNTNPVVPPPPATDVSNSTVFPSVPIPPPIPPNIIQDLGNLVCTVREDICTGETVAQRSRSNCNPTSDSNVPGPITQLCWNNRVQPWLPRQHLVMSTATVRRALDQI